MSKFGLGRGLSELKQETNALPADIYNIVGTERVVVKQIPIAQISANPDQPRKTFTDAELNDLAASIREKGVLQPILLRTVTGRPYLYEIVAGERRYRASKLAGLTEIPALVKNLNDKNAMEIALIENVQRENLNPIEEAAGYKNLMARCGYTLADVSRLIGKSESYIRNIMRLDSLPSDVKTLVEQGSLSASHARTISVAENPAELAQKIMSDNLSVAQTEQLVKGAKRSLRSRAYNATGIDNDALDNMTQQIKKSLKTPVKIQEKRGGAGQIIVSFSNRNQLKELVEKLSSL